jgi:hypothetical protein
MLSALCADHGESSQSRKTPPSPRFFTSWLSGDASPTLPSSSSVHDCENRSQSIIGGDRLRRGCRLCLLVLVLLLFPATSRTFRCWRSSRPTRPRPWATNVPIVRYGVIPSTFVSKNLQNAARSAASTSLIENHRISRMCGGR